MSWKDLEEWRSSICCPEDDGGSHHHCSYCGCVCSLMGHFNSDGELDCPPKSKRPWYAEEFVDEDE